MHADRWAVSALVYTRIAYSRGSAEKQKAIPFNYGSTKAGGNIYVFRVTRRPRRQWMLAVSVVFVGFSDGSSAGNKIGQTNAEKLS